MRKGGISPKKRGRLLRFPQGRDFPEKNGAGCFASRKCGISPKKRGRLLRFPQGRDFPEKTGQAASLPANAGFPRKNGAGCFASRKGGISLRSTFIQSINHSSVSINGKST